MVPSFSFLCVMRVMDSITAVTSSGPRIVVRSPTSTSPVTSLGRSTLVGRNSGSMYIAGAIELPPDSELREPIRSTTLPRAPVIASGYSGLCGLLPVSLSERAGITQPSTLPTARLAFSRMPSSIGLSA